MPTISTSPGNRMRSRCRYLTARCPSGCESWLHPRAVELHVGLGRCRGEPWVDNIEDSAVIPEPAATLFVQRLPAGLIAPVRVSAERVRSISPTERVRNDVLHGVVVRSPIASVRARRWVYVVTAAIDRDGPDAIERGISSTGFVELERELQADDWLVDCPDCGETVKCSRINLHRTKSTLCRWKRAGADVRRLWEAGGRDPYSVPGAPLRWDALRGTAVWRHRLRTIEFPRWVAVLLSPDPVGS